jgi:hypothetical protein
MRSVMPSIESAVDARIILTGDFNKQTDADVVPITGLNSSVDFVTRPFDMSDIHTGNTLDRIYVWKVQSRVIDILSDVNK